MRIVDLSHVIEPGMPVYPGTEPPVIAQANTIQEHGFREAKLTLFSHTGTHMDAPAHMLVGGTTLDQYDAAQFVGMACVVDCTPCGPNIGMDVFKPYEKAIAECEFVLLHTGWNQHWGSDAYFTGYPTLCVDAAICLTKYALKGVGIDAISLDPSDPDDFAVHKILLARGMVLIENLTNLDAVINRPFLFSALPLRLTDADGSPIRAVAIEQD